MIITVRVFEDLLYQIFGHVTLERAPGAQLLQTLEGVIKAKRRDTAKAKGREHRHGQEEKDAGVIQERGGDEIDQNDREETGKCHSRAPNECYQNEGSQSTQADEHNL